MTTRGELDDCYHVLIHTFLSYAVPSSSSGHKENAVGQLLRDLQDHAT